MTIGERIRKRRKELGLTVEQLAEKLNKNRATIYRYESDEIENMSISVLEPLAKALYCTPTYLMGWDDDEPVSKDEFEDNEIRAIAAHAAGNLSEESIKKIIAFAKFIKSQEEDGE